MAVFRSSEATTFWDDDDWVMVGSSRELPAWMCMHDSDRGPKYDYYIAYSNHADGAVKAIGITNWHYNYRQTLDGRIGVYGVDGNIIGRADVRVNWRRRITFEIVFGGTDVHPPLNTLPEATLLPNGLIKVWRKIEWPWAVHPDPEQRLVFRSTVFPG